MKGRRAKRDRITIQSEVTEIGNYGQKKTVRWENVIGLVDIPADFAVTGGTESFRGQQVQADVVAVFTIRQHPTAITPLHRVLHVGHAYGVVSVRPSDGPHESGHRDTLIFVKALADIG
jgi:hypothetical protein